MEMERIRFLKEREVAKMTGLSLGALRNFRLKKTGFPYCKIGRSVRYPLQDLISYCERNKVQLDLPHGAKGKANRGKRHGD